SVFQRRKAAETSRSRSMKASELSAVCGSGLFSGRLLWFIKTSLFPDRETCPGFLPGQAEYWMRPGRAGRMLCRLNAALMGQDHMPDRFEHGAADVGARQRQCDIGLDETLLGAAIECPPLIGMGVEALGIRQLQHAVGQLDLVAGAAFLLREE